MKKYCVIATRESRISCVVLAEDEKRAEELARSYWDDNGIDYDDIEEDPSTGDYLDKFKAVNED
jgi:hypothetical protein